MLKRKIEDKLVNGFRLKAHNLSSPSGKRRVRVLLPKNYEMKRESYPVVYMLDGQNLFFDEESYSKYSWRVSECLNEYPDLAEFLIVAIDNGADRLHEYSPWELDSNYSFLQYPLGGGGIAHAKFIINTVKNFIDENYRTLPEAENTAIVASSLAASLASFIGIEYQYKIGALGLFSLNNFLFEKSFIRYVAGKELNVKQRIYLQVGTDELTSEDSTEDEKIKSRQDYLNASLNYIKILLNKDFPHENIDFHIYANEKHHEKFWSKHLAECFRYISADW